MRRKFAVLSVNQKLDIIKDVKNNIKTARQLASEHNCDVSTINRILRSEDRIQKVALSNPKRKRARTSVYHDVDKALTDWFHKARSQNATINSTTLMFKAQEFATKLKSSLKPSNGWLWRWQKRENVKFKKLRNEDSCELIEEDMSNVLVENFISQKELDNEENGVIDKPVRPPRRRENDEHVPSFEEVLKALVVLRRFMMHRKMDMKSLERIEEEVMKIREASLEAAKHDEV